MFVEHKEAGEAPVKPLDEAGRVLMEAADFLEQRKWFPGEGRDCREAHCAWDAICLSQGSSMPTELSYNAGNRLAHALGLRRVSQIFTWNDAKDRTKEEVIAKLRAVALGA